MSASQTGSQLGRQYLILFLIVGIIVVFLGYVFRQAGMFFKALGPALDGVFQ